MDLDVSDQTVTCESRVETAAMACSID